MTLTRAQRAALAHVEREALQRRRDAEADLASSLETGSIPRSTYAAALDNLRSRGRVACAFHPERITRSGATVVDGLLADGVYRSQFETGLSGGSTTAYAGGARGEWERRLYGGVYHAPGVDLSERPKYGALFLVAHPDGPCPRFGSTYLVLRPEVSARCSFTLLGSQENRADAQTGTLDVPEPMMAALARHIGSVPAPLGVEGLGFGGLISGMADDVPMPRPGIPDDHPGRALDTFVEAQVHGTVDLARDVEELVVDASFYGTTLATALTELAARYHFSLRWHPGFRLRADEVPGEFRGFPARPVAERVAKDGLVDAAILGAGHNAFESDPDAWADLGAPTDVRTSFRRVWHVLVLEGRPSPYWSDVPFDRRVTVKTTRREPADG